VYTELRERAKEDTVEAQLWIKMNYTKVFFPAKADAQAAKHAEGRAKKREKAQEDIDELWAKRVRNSQPFPSLRPAAAAAAAAAAAV